MIPSYPKIFAVGTKYIQDIFSGPVEVTEKVDGSQFSFGDIGGELSMRSKGAQLFADNPEKMFAKGIEYVLSIQTMLPPDTIFYTEYLNKPKHNTLSYARVPLNNMMLFGVMSADQHFDCDLVKNAEMLGIEPVPVLRRGEIANASELTSLLDAESILGNAKIEGVVVKNYAKPFILGGAVLPLMAGKYVSESFKEVHRERWGVEEKSKSRLDIFFDSFRTEARWEKAVQHLRDAGVLEGSPKDIGALFKEIHTDIEAEEIEEAKAFLWKEFSGELKRRASAGVAEWYKKRLLGSAFQRN